MQQRIFARSMTRQEVKNVNVGIKRIYFSPIIPNSVSYEYNGLSV